MELRQSYWNMRSETYDEQSGSLYQDAYDRTAAGTVKYLKPTDRVLDFACGTGIVTYKMAPHAARVLGIDQAGEMVARARAKGGAENLEFRQMELFDPALEPGSFDVVTAFNVLCYVQDHRQVLGRIRELLKPGGYFISATDCLGERITKAGLRKWYQSHTGQMPYVAFDSMSKLEKKITDAGFQLLEQENLFPAPPNLFLVGRK